MNENYKENSITKGLNTVLYTRYSSATVNDEIIQKAFEDFSGNSISVAEILKSAEAVTMPSKKINSGDLILMADNSFNNSKITSNIMSGVHSLVAADKGFSLELDKIGSIEQAQIKQYVIVSEKSKKKLLKKASKANVSFTEVGKILSEDKIILKNSDNSTECIDKIEVYSNDNSSIVLGNYCFEAYLNGYLSVCSLKISDCISNNNILRFGLGGNPEMVLARALGVYAAAKLNKVFPIRVVFTDDNSTSVAVPRPIVSDGDYFYLLKLRTAENGIPDRIHFAQLCYYLTEKKREGVIKDVLPIKENIQSVFKRLQGDSLVYESLADLPDNSFGAIVSVPRGESVNGIKLGYFKCN